MGNYNKNGACSVWDVCEMSDIIKLRPCADWTRFMHLKTFIPEHDQNDNLQWHQCQMFCLVDLVMQMTLLNRIRSFPIKALLIHSENIASFSDDLQTINCLVAKLPDTTEISNDASMFSIVYYFHVNKMYLVFYIHPCVLFMSVLFIPERFCSHFAKGSEKPCVDRKLTRCYLKHLKNLGLHLKERICFEREQILFFKRLPHTPMSWQILSY